MPKILASMALFCLIVSPVAAQDAVLAASEAQLIAAPPSTRVCSDPKPSRTASPEQVAEAMATQPRLPHAPVPPLAEACFGTGSDRECHQVAYSSLVKLLPASVIARTFEPQQQPPPPDPDGSSYSCGSRVAGYGSSNCYGMWTQYCWTTCEYIQDYGWYCGAPDTSGPRREYWLSWDGQYCWVNCSECHY